MSKYSCDNWSWSSRRCDPRFRDRDANKENREPISPLSLLAERVDDTRRWAPIPDRWHNHCEWLVNHHRNLRKRFRRTTANDRLAGVLTTLKCTRERRRGSDEDKSVVGRGSRCKRISDVEYPELEPASIWLGSVHPELFQLEKVLSPPKIQPFSERGDEMEVETQKSEPDLKADDVNCNPTIPNPSTENDKSTVETVKTSTAAATQSTFRSPSPVEGAFEPENFRTSTPTAEERSRRDPEEPCASFRRSSAWKDYVMSHDPILFRSYVNTQYPKKSWRNSHQKVAARHCGKYRRSSSGQIRKPPTPKSLRISWNSLDDVVQNEGILRSPLRLPPILPGDVTPPTNSDKVHGVDVQLDDNLSANDSHADVDMSDVIGDGIRAIRKDCRARYQSANDSYAASDERDVESSVDPSELSDISYDGEEEGESTDKHDYDLEDISSDDDIEDICRIVDKELHHDDYHPDDILSEISFDILDDLEVDSKYPPNYFRAGFADRAVRRRKIKKVMRMINKLDPQARSFKPRYKHEENNGDQRIVKFADRETSDDNRDKEKMEDACGSGTKFYPSDVRFNKKDGVKKVGETPKASAHKHAESKVVIPLPVPVPVKRVDPKRVHGKNVKECGSLKNRESEVKEGIVDDQEQCLKGEVCKTIESERPVPNSEAGLMADVEKNEKTPSIKPIAKGKLKRQVAHKISVVMGRRPGKPSQTMENRTGDDGGRSVSRSLAAGDDDNGGVMPKRIPQLRQIEMIHQGNANAVGKDLMRPSSGENVIKRDGTVSDKFTAKNVTFEARGHKDAAQMEESVQSRALQSDASIRSIDVTQPRYSGLMKQRLALLKESYGNSPMGAANLTDRLQEQLDSKKTTAVAKGLTSNECEQPRMAKRQEFGHRDVELPDVNNNRIANNVPQAKINPLSTFADAGNNDEIDKGKGISDLSSGSQQNELSCTKTCPAKAKQPESLVNVGRAMPLQSEQKEIGRGSGNPLSETGRENCPPQPLIQNPPHRFPHPHHNMNPNVHPNMHPNMRVMPGNAPLYQHPSDQQHPFNPTFSAYHHHQMALRTAAMHYYNQQRHMVLQRHPPGFYHPHPHHMNMHPGYRPEWKMPGPGPPR